MEVAIGIITKPNLLKNDILIKIFKVTDNKTHKSQMTDEDWILYCDTASKCVRYGTVWGPKEMTDFKPAELSVLQLFLNKREKNV